MQHALVSIKLTQIHNHLIKEFQSKIKQGTLASIGSTSMQYALKKASVHLKRNASNILRLHNAVKVFIVIGILNNKSIHQTQVLGLAAAIYFLAF